MTDTPQEKGAEGGFDRWNSFWITAMACTFALVRTTLQLIPAVQAYQTHYMLPQTLISILLNFIFFMVLFAFGIQQRNNRLGLIAITYAVVDTGAMIFEIFQRLSSFTLAQAVWGIMTLAGMLALIFILLQLLVKSIRELRRIRDYFPRLKAHIKQGGLKAAALGLCLIVSGTVFLIMTQRNFGQQIEIRPQNYQIQFRMWANYDPAYYQTHPHGTEMLNQMNKHNVTIQNAIFAIRDGEGRYESFAPTMNATDVNTTVTTLKWFQTNYPQIRFQYYAFGLGANSCGNYEGSIYTGAMLKRFVDVCRNYSITNVVGVYTDWEGPLNTAPKYSNETLNGWHQYMWTDAMAYTRTYFPNWVFSCCCPDDMIWDYFDGDADLQYYSRYNIWMPEWDDYGAMVYRSCNVNDTADGTDNSRGSWIVYAQAYALLNGALKGDVSKATMWLGCTGCGPYNNETTVYEHGKPMEFGEGKGFDALCRDILILKHFGFKTVSIFLALERFEAYGFTTGFFDQYGYADALDRLNTTVNGPESTKPFYIWSEGDWMPTGLLARDFMLNFDRYTYFAWFVGYFAFGFICTKLLSLKCNKKCNKTPAPSTEPVVPK